jgi:hypothetical protein
MLNQGLDEDKGAVSDIHLVFVFEDVILTDPVYLGAGEEPTQVGDVETVSPAGYFGMGGGDEPSHGRDVIRAFSHQGDFLGNLIFGSFSLEHPI